MQKKFAGILDYLMEQDKISNLLEIEDLVKSFIKDQKQGLSILHKVHYKTDNELAFKAFLIEIENDIKTGCVTYINKKYPIDEINNYLFYIANAFCKKNAISIPKRKIEYLCPGCLYLGKENILGYSQIFSCNVCKKELNSELDPKRILLFSTFYKHNKSGFHCQDCNRFIPNPLDNNKNISCPYFDCYFSGELSSLKKMHHPTLEFNLKSCFIKSKIITKDNLVSNEIDIYSKLELQDDFKEKIKVLKEVIDSQSSTIFYSSSDFTIKHKGFVYQAINNLISAYPSDMVNYLLNDSRSGGFQHKIFQEYIKLLEESLPFTFKKNGKLYRIETLLDDNMCIFDGISIYDAIVSDKMEIKNNTQEFYIGGRKAAYTKPYYMGKLLSIVNKKTKKSLLDQVKEYSFIKIKLKDVTPGTEVVISHLRIPPHYQMGGMVYVNRIRKKIVEKALVILNK